MAKIIEQDGRKYNFTSGKGGKLISPSRKIGKPGLLGTFEPNTGKSKTVPTPLVPNFKKEMKSVPGAIRGSLPMKRKNIVRALGSRSIY